MRRDDITSLVCLSCVLFFFYVNSQNSCPSGWFGTECKYKCRCTDDKCDPSGACTDPYICQGGWFGPACQYADMAYDTSNVSALTDGKDNTCVNEKGLDRLLILLKQPFVFTWLRLHVTDEVSDALNEVQMTLSHREVGINCPDLKTHVVDSRTLDMHCISKDTINKITIIGNAVSSLCSVYVSGGRNVALKEKAEQGRTYWSTSTGVNISYWAWLAVDGDTRQNFSSGTCSRTDQAQDWSLRLSKPRSVHTYVIYNRVDAYMDRLAGFTLEGFDQMNESAFKFTDANLQGKPNYTYIVGRHMSIQAFSLTVNNSERVLNLCEFEVYGDSICDNGSYGFECERSCNCLNGEACFVSTGGCSSGCPAGFIGETCQTSCKVGMFGAHCNTTCSEHCEPPGDPNLTPCNASTGECLTGCEPGFTGSRCFDRCKVGMFGEHCNTTCSENCKPTGDPNLTPCDVSTGECLTGCQPGFTGNNCLDSCKVGMFGEQCNTTCSQRCKPTGDPNLTPCDVSTGECLKGCQPGFTGKGCLESARAAGAESELLSLELVIGMCVLLALLLFLGYCLYPRKKAKPKQELVDATGHLSAAPEGL